MLLREGCCDSAPWPSSGPGVKEWRVATQHLPGHPVHPRPATCAASCWALGVAGGAVIWSQAQERLSHATKGTRDPCIHPTKAARGYRWPRLVIWAPLLTCCAACETHNGEVAGLRGLQS